MRDFANRTSPPITLASRGVLCQTPPPPGSEFLSGGVSGRDGQFRAQSRVGWLGLSRVLTGHTRTFRGKSRKPLPFSRSGLIIGDSRGSGVLPESTLELADRMLFFDREPVSAAVVGASLLVKLQHLALRIVELPPPLLEAPLKLDRAFHTAKLQDHSNQ